MFNLAESSLWQHCDGLDVQVAFGDVWKESLSELSGGQRSLIALSLVFALLKNRPAPLYILDEVRHHSSRPVSRCRGQHAVPASSQTAQCVEHG